MPRPKRYRRIDAPPGIKGFRPLGGYSCKEVVRLLTEEYEAIRLADYEGLSQLEASERMEVSRPTFTRMYSSARKKIAKALVEKKPVIIKGGHFLLDDEWFRCSHCDNTFRIPGNNTPLTNCPICQSEKVSKAGPQKAAKLPRAKSGFSPLHTRSLSSYICGYCGFELDQMPKEDSDIECPDCGSQGLVFQE